MNIHKILSYILKTPLVLLIIGSLIGSWYAAYKHIQGIEYSTPFIYTIIFIAYIIGGVIKNQDDQGHNNKDKNQ